MPREGVAKPQVPPQLFQAAGGLRGGGGSVCGRVWGCGRPSAVTRPVSVPKDANVRMKCILALKALYEKRESAMKLGLFFHKFKVREVLRLGCCLLRGISVSVWTGRAQQPLGAQGVAHVGAGCPGRCAAKVSPERLGVSEPPAELPGCHCAPETCALAWKQGVGCAHPQGAGGVLTSIMGVGATRGGPRTCGWLGVGVGPRRCTLDVRSRCAWRGRPSSGECGTATGPRPCQHPQRGLSRNLARAGAQQPCMVVS